MSALRVVQLRQDVTVAPLSLAHAANMYRWMCDPEISRNIGLRTEPSLNKTIAWINGARENPLIEAFAAFLGAEHVGNVVLDRIDRHLDSARLSVYIGEATARGSGVGRTAIYRTLCEGFRRLNLHKVWLTVHNQNIPAIKTYIQLGFALEGILRDEFWCDGERVPVFYFGLVRQEFDQIVEE